MLLRVNQFTTLFLFMQDIASSFGSLDSVPDMPSPDVDFITKDLIDRRMLHLFFSIAFFLCYL